MSLNFTISNIFLKVQKEKKITSSGNYEYWCNYVESTLHIWFGTLGADP